MTEKNPEYVLVHLRLRKDLYEKLWDLTKKRFTIPTKKFHIVVNDIISEYFERQGGSD